MSAPVTAKRFEVRTVTDAGTAYRILLFYCPGCKMYHAPNLDPAPGRDGVWTLSGTETQPTLTPSVVYEAGTRCHSFVRDGKLHFLSDCTHLLAGQTVEPPALDRDGE